MDGQLIVESEVIPLLLDACPGFQEAWDGHRAYWGDEEAGSFNDIATFAHYLIDLARTGRTECFPPVFAVVERMMAHGDDRVQNMAVVGVLEDLQNIALNTGLDWNLFLPWLGPLSRAAWFDLIKDWDEVIANKLRQQRGKQRS
jgi:hypothetical protein